MAEFKYLVMSQTLSVNDVKALNKICTSWEGYSAAISNMDLAGILKTLRYLMVRRPHSKTFGERAVQRYNSLNKVRWEELHHE